MTWFAKVAFALTAAIGIAVSAGAGAQETSDADRAAIRAIISDQIAAFRADDFDAAYSFASPTIRDLFPSVERFRSMVTKGYRPVYRPRSVTFGEIAEAPGGPLQKVFLTGPDGDSWLAIYTLQRQPDGSWRINGVRLAKDDGATI